MDSVSIATQGIHWAYLPVLTRLALALALGLLVGMERERRGKEAGARTFAFAALLGCLGGLLGDGYALLSLALLGLLIVFLNWQRLATNQTAELTTSVALLVTGTAGILAGKGHQFTPVTVGIATAAILAWKERVTHFSTGLTEAELRSAILLGIISFVVYPVLPERPLDPWGLIEPRTAWMTVILIAAIGFGNYILLKLYGERGMELSGLLGGLVNSTVVATELANRAREGGERMANLTYRGVLLATAAMLLRNGVLLGLLAPRSLFDAALPLGLMLIGCIVLVLWRRPKKSDEPFDSLSSLGLESPFSLRSALKFGLIFLALDIAGILGQRLIGTAGFYAVSAVGGLVSSASSVASAGALAAKGHVTGTAAGTGAMLASLASALVDIPLVWRISRQRSLTLRITRALGLILLLGAIGILLQPLCPGVPPRP